MSILDEPDPEADGNVTPHDHARTYQNMMDIGFRWGLPLGVAAAMLAALLLLGTNVIVAFIIAFFTWLGTLAFSKAFFIHAGAEGERH